MLKEVGASGLISLGKKYAGRTFDVIAHPGGRLELIPVRLEASASHGPSQIVQSSDGWLPPGGYDDCTRWTLDNREALEQYARRVEEEGTAAEQLQRFLNASDHDGDDHGKV